jgi:2-polyprenyl-3-methyl-5-hydroxy-6-metoxy-1,4-benzoquinol methylase
LAGVDREAIQKRRDAIVREHGRWTNYNIDLGGVWTIGPNANAMAEDRVERVVQAVNDVAPKPLSELRVLDLAFYEGAFALAFARRGASVVGLEARTEHVVKARFAAEALQLGNVSFERADVRELARDRHGSFDVVLCLGILYHLDAPDCFDFLKNVADVCDGLAVIETQISLSRQKRISWGGREYEGKSYPEDTRFPGASADNAQSFWPTKASLLNAMTDVGFTSILELKTPLVPSVAAFRDHVVLLAWQGDRDVSFPRWPERLWTSAHPTQGRRHWVRDRLVRLRGGGADKAFRRPESS